jgi:HEAT repeat protein
LIKAINAGLRLDVAAQQTSEAERLARYRQRLLDDTRFVSLRGIPQPCDHHGRTLQLGVPLDAIYVRVFAIEEQRARAAEKAHERAAMETGATRAASLGARLYQPDESSESTRNSALDPERLLCDYDRVVILGEAGSGKSTLLRYVARQSVQSVEERLPLLVSLREYGTALAADARLSLREFAVTQACCGDRELRQVLHRKIREARVLWLLDGLDEAQSRGEQVAREIADLPGRLMLTSRPSSYDTAGLNQLPHFEMLPLATADVDHFLEQWFEILARQRSDSPSPACMFEAFKAQLARRPQLEQVVRNPLMLTFLAVLAGDDPSRDLPAQRTELYRRYVEELIHSWEVNRRASPAPGARDDSDEERRARLSGFYFLGWYLQLGYYGGQGDTSPSRRKVIEALGSYFRTAGFANGAALGAQVTEHWLQAGMLDVWTIAGEEFLAFRHLTFQEYAVATQLAALWRADSFRAWNFLYPRMHHHASRAPVLMMIGILGGELATAAVRCLLSARSRYERILHRDLLFAAAAVGEFASMPDQLAQTIVGRLTRLLLRSPKGRTQNAISKGYTLIWLYFLFSPFRLLLIPWFLFYGLVWAPIGTIVKRLFATPMSMGQRAFTRLRRYLRTEVHDRLALAEALARTGRHEAMQGLGAALGYPEKSVAQAAALGLARFGRAALPVVVPALRTSATRWAALALGQMGSAVIPDVMDLMKDQKPSVRCAAIRAAQDLRDTRLIEPLIEKLVDPETAVRRMAAEALAHYRDRRATNSLIRLLRDEVEVAAAAAYALGNIGDAAAIPALAAVVTKTARIVVDDYYSQLNDAVDFVVPPPVWSVYAAAAEALGKLGGSDAVEALNVALQLRYPAAIAAAPALAATNDPKGVIAIIDSLKSGDSSSQRAALNALPLIAAPGAVDLLSEALREENMPPAAHDAVAATLRRLAGNTNVSDVAPAPKEATQSAEPSTHAQIKSEALQLAESVEALLATLRGDSEAHVRESAATSLAELSSRLFDLKLLHRVEHALWLSLTEADARIMTSAFARVAARTAMLEAQDLPVEDPLLTILRPSPA